jgi:hypothetical protein
MLHGTALLHTAWKRTVDRPDHGTTHLAALSSLGK